MQKLLTSNEIASLFNVAPQTVRVWTSRGILPSVKFAGIRRYRAEDIEQILKGDGNSGSAGTKAKRPV